MGLLCEPTNMRLLLILAFFSSLLALSVGNPVPQRPGRPGAVVGRPRPGGRPGAVFGCFVVQGNFPKDLRSPKVFEAFTDMGSWTRSFVGVPGGQACSAFLEGGSREQRCQLLQMRNIVIFSWPEICLF